MEPGRGLVIVKLSAFRDYATSLEDAAYRELETLEFSLPSVGLSSTRLPLLRRATQSVDC